jgi:uncharacterized protein YcbK (DUF882 family)
MTLGAVALAATLAVPRFFVAGDGTLAIANVHTGDAARVTYRRADGSYDAEALGRIRRVLRSRDGVEGDVSVRLVELLGWLYVARDHEPVRIQSGYRSPDYNETIRARGARAAGGSLHTEGLAADVALPASALEPLWMRVRGLDCCGAGYYRAEGFLHLDVGQPRFWEPQTSKVEQNLSAGNARLFARTEFDRYAAGEAVVVTLHALTAPPVRIAKEARLVDESGERVVRLDARTPDAQGCVDVADRGVRLRVAAVPVARHARLLLSTCAPRPERTPEVVGTNPIDVGGE